MSYETLRKTVENPLYNEKEISELSKVEILNKLLLVFVLVDNIE